MPEHVIRLRGGWEWMNLDDGQSCPTRLTLPAHFHFAGASRVRLSRRFGRPPFDPRAESLWLCLSQVPGLKSITLNGAPLALEPVGTSCAEIALGELLDRNVLVLDADLPAAEFAGLAGGSVWGEVSLRVRSIEH